MTVLRIVLIASSFFAFLAGTPVSAQGFDPDEAARRMELPEGFSVFPVATEPEIRQPLAMQFDERGRMWVLQYIQYPTPAGLKPVTQDQYLRTVWDKTPKPPPHGEKGADKITIMFDPDENGIYRKSKDFLTGGNLISGFCLGHGGVFVLQSPYLLFYPDRDGDDIPDGDPEVLLTGFGFDDTHSVANSLQWGPDGWLYGAAGSTSTSRIKNPADPKGPAIEFQQGIWRYHPKTRTFELFSEGGGNTFGLDFDQHGHVIAGTNYGNYAMLHQYQGAYYVKSFGKHGPLHNPHTYGYFHHVPYEKFKGGHVTCGGVMYHADAYPKEFHGRYIAGNLLSNAVYWHEMTPNESTFTAKHGGDLVVANDTWFRPVHLKLGPDGSVYVADWYDKRAAHLDPVDTWDRTNGRIYRIAYQGTEMPKPFDLRKQSPEEWLKLLAHPNQWWRNEARRLLAENPDPKLTPTLRQQVKSDDGLLALESLWALYTTGGFDEQFAREVGLKHRFTPVRMWTVRLLGDFTNSKLETETAAALEKLAENEASPVVRAQLACTAKRLTAEQGLPVAGAMLARAEDANDPFIPLLIWWAFEGHVQTNSDTVTQEALARADHWANPLGQAVLERLARRYVSAKTPHWNELGKLIAQVGDQPKALDTILNGVSQALEGAKPASPPPPQLLALLQSKPSSMSSRILVRLGDQAEQKKLFLKLLDVSVNENERKAALQLLTQVRAAELGPILPKLLQEAKSDGFRTAVLDSLSVFDPDGTAELLLQGFPNWSRSLQQKVIGMLTSRPKWALALMQAVDQEKFPKDRLSVDSVRPAIELNDQAVTALVEKHWGKVGPTPPGEKRARIAYLNLVLNRQGLGDVTAGKQVFAKQCAACHQLFGEGGKVGPDLTAADRKNRGYMLTHIVDPSGYIRPEYVSYKVDTIDGRTLTGLLSEANERVTVTNVVDNEVRQVELPKADIEEMNASPVSLMPEKLLDSLSENEVRDLFAYLMAENPPADAEKNDEDADNAAGNGDGEKKFRVVLISGSLEYKSDESLKAYQTYLEKHFPITCVQAFRKNDKDIPGLEALADCDAAIFFTRRLTPEPKQLEMIQKYVESGKPIVGVRTASHGFQNWLEMDDLVFGGSYKGHTKHGIEAQITLTEWAAESPLAEGVKPFATTGGLYINPKLAEDVKVLAVGNNGKESEPVAWVRERKLDGKPAQKVFYTSLGTPEDFAEESFVRLLTNGLLWSLGRQAEVKPAK